MYVCQLKSKFQVEMEISIVQNISVLVPERCQQLCCRFEVDISVDMLVKLAAVWRLHVRCDRRLFCCQRQIAMTVV